ncbi:MAG: DUF6144 family protein [Ignavibacteriaceae bacterium]
MDRRKFVTKSAKAGALTCAAICFGGADKCIANTLLPDSNETPCEKKVEFSQTWVKRFMNVLDGEVDEKTRIKIMETQGKACYLGSLEHRNVKPEDIPATTPEDFVKGINQYAGEEAASFKDNVIEFRYVKNPAGLKVADGFCLCPLVEKGPEGLSGTYCHCSVGYVKEMFGMYLKRQVEVELLESLKRGGKTCRFKITLV